MLDLSATDVLHDGAAPALQLLAVLLQESNATLRLVLPGTQAQAELLRTSAGTVLGPDSVYASARAAMLAAYAAMPGSALVTAAVRERLAQPPEALPLPG